jgi:PAS domain S-box-containing protein
MEASTAEQLSATRDSLASAADFPKTETEAPECSQTMLSRQEEEVRGRLAALVESSDDAIIAKSLDGTITSWNPGAERLFGYFSSEVVGKSMRMLLPPERANEESDILARIGRGERVDHFQTVRVRKDGTTIEVSVTISPIKDGRGAIVGASKIARDITGRKRAEDALKQSLAAREAALQELAGQKFALDQHAIVATTDVQGTITYVNDKFCTISQYARHELIGQNHRILNSGHHPSEFFQQMYHAITQGKVWRGEIKNRAKDGSMYWLEATIVPLMGADGRPRQYIAIRTDITERKRAERTLQALSACSDALLRATDETSLLQQICDLTVKVGGYRMAWVGYAEHDKKKTVRAVARSGFEDGYLDTLQLTWADQERGRGPAGTAIRTGEVDVCHDVASDPRFAPWRENATQRGYCSSLALPLKNGDEALGALSIYATQAGAFNASEQHLLRELANNLSYGILTLRSRAERVRGKDALQASEQRYCLLFNEMQMGFALLDVISDKNGVPCDFRYREVNRAFETHTGLPRHQVVGKTIRQVLPGIEPFWIETYGKVATTGESVHFEKYTETLHRWIQATAFRTGQGQLAVTFADVSERRQAEQILDKSRIAIEAAFKELGRSNAELEQFAYVASHDLQEPLRMIANYTQLLGERYRGKLDEQADKYIHYAVDGATRMQALIQDLLKFSRVGTQQTVPRATECGAVVEQALENLHAAMQENGAVVNWDGLPLVMADSSQLTQVFQNLIGNAIKFHGAEAPMIQIGAEEKDHEWILTVSDNGIGIPSESWEEIFVIFRRLHTRTEYAGNGIGLSLCKKIIERHGGKIWIEAQAKPGCCFRFTLPMEVAKAEQGAHA